jgi:Fe-S-cluster-containing dehydrogenase component/CRP-like cAMP-binding protein
LLITPAMSSIDAGRFPTRRPLREIVREHGRFVRFQRGDIIVSAGDYGSSVFVILDGSVRVLLDPEGARRIAGRRATTRRSFWNVLTQHWRAFSIPEVRIRRRDTVGAASVRREEDDARLWLRNVDAVLEEYRTAALSKGQMFGEIAALTRSPRTATLFAEDDVELIELRWQGLREIRLRDPTFRKSLDDLYRSRNLAGHLKEIPLFANLEANDLDTLAASAVLESYGEPGVQDPTSRSSEISERVVDVEQLIAEEGHYLDGLIVLRSGIARVSRALDHGHRTTGYLTANEVFGFEELVDHWKRSTPLRLRSSLRAAGYVDVLRIPTTVVLEHLLPKLREHQLPQADLQQKERLTPAWSSSARTGELEQGLLDALVDRRIINGQAAMLIDTDRCVECDDCVAACATTHDNNPRFVRHGPSHANLTFATACMHCMDPVCLVGCPTGAIHRSPGDLRVEIDDMTCIGCSTCADACPYDAIRMVEIRTAGGGWVYDSATSLPVVEATKCDLCVGQWGGPACERACPHDALVRLDLRERRQLADWIAAKGSKLRHILMGAVVAVSSVLLVGAHRVWGATLQNPDELTGWALLAFTVVLMLLGLRKRLPGLPLLKASLWRRAHIVVGSVALVALVLHAGARPPNGVLETLLWIGFVAVGLSGVIGVLLARWLPSRLGRYGQRVLPDRINGKRRQLAQEVAELAMKSVRETATSTLADYHAERLAPFMRRHRNFFKHLIESNRPYQRLREEMDHLARYLDPRGRELLGEIEACVADKDNLDHQQSLLAVLQGWRLLHGPVAGVLGVVILFHVVLALAFSGGGS